MPKVIATTIGVDLEYDFNNNSNFTTYPSVGVGTAWANNADDLEAQAVARFKELALVEWTWDKFKGKCKDPIRKEGKKLWTNILTAMRDAGIGEVTKSKPLTFRRHTDVDGHRRMSV